MSELKSSAAQLRASAKYHLSKRETRIADMKSYYIRNKEEILRNKRIRYAKQKLEKASYNADLSQSASERLPYILKAHLASLEIMSLESAST